MPQTGAQSIRNQFNKGLLTEFSELGFPENASIDELNCDLFKAGNRSRRLGISFEDGYSLSTETYFQGDLFQVVGEWKTVAKDPQVTFIVVQAGKHLIFYEKDNTLSPSPIPVSDSDSSTYRIDLNNYAVTNSGVDMALTPVQVTSLNGFLIVVAPSMKSFYVSRDKSSNAFTVTEIDFKVRDFEWQTSDVEDLLEISSVSPDVQRQYDTLNAGWTNVQDGTTPLTTFQSTYPGQEPALVLPWYSGKNSSGDFVVAEWIKVSAGTSLAANGHFILNLFNKDRATASGISSLPVESTTERFSTTASFAGRVWYSGFENRVYFSRLVELDNEFGLLYQVNDPTAEDFNSLLDTDGGYITIPEAANIKKLHVFGSSILVFADNGVWRISGVDGVFRATEYSVYKITNEGIASSLSFVAGENNVPFWWSSTGIHTVQVTEEGGMVEVNLSRDTIQTFWNNIESAAKEKVRAAYDATNDRVIWMYPNNGETISGKLNNLLFLDTSVGAFFPWKISDKSANNNYILDAAAIEGTVFSSETFNIIDTSGNQVIDSNTDTVVEDINSAAPASSNVAYLTYTSSGQITFSSFRSDSFLDWEQEDYSSYAEAAYNFIGDLGRRKQAPYLTVFCRTTESSWEANGNTYNFNRPSSLLVSNYWDFKTTPNSNQQQAYRIRRPVVVSEDLTYTPEHTVNVSRLKLRGRGRVIRLRFESEQGKDFNLLGWELLGARNGNY